MFTTHAVFKRLICVLSLSLILSFFTYISLFLKPKDIVESDFANYLTGASIVKGGLGDFLYDLSLNTKHQEKVLGVYEKKVFLPFRYPPFVAVLFVPLLNFPLEIGFKIFSLFNISLLLLLALAYSFSARKVEKSYLWILTAFVYLPNIYSLFYGQVTIFLAFIFFLVYLLLRQKKDFWAGVMSGFFFIKPQYVLLVPFVFVVSKRRAGFVKGFLTSFVILFVLSSLLTSWNFVEDYLRFIWATENIAFGTRLGDMFSATSALLYIAEHTRAINSSFVFVVSSLAYLLTLYLFSKYTKFRNLEVKFLIIPFFFLIFSPHILTSDLSILTFPLLFILSEMVARNWKSRLFFFIPCISLFLLPATSLIPDYDFVFINSGLLVLVTLWMCFILTREKLLR